MGTDYTILFASPLNFATYSFLSLSIASLWIHRKPIIFTSILCVAIIFGLFANRLQWPALLFIVLFAGVNYLTFNSEAFLIKIALMRIKSNKKSLIVGGFLSIAVIVGLIKSKLVWPTLVFTGLFTWINFLKFNRTSQLIKIVSGILIALLSVLIGLHQIPGFSNWLIIQRVYLSPDAMPFNLFLNFDKPLIGLFILGFGHIILLKTFSEWLEMFKNTIPIAIIGILSISILSTLFGFVKFDLKFNALFTLWVLSNLFFTCIAEEALFRGLIQNSLSHALKSRRCGDYYAISIASILFGIMHYNGGLLYIVLTAIAGAFYGIAYLKTRRIESAILTHCLLNVAHFIGFTYPALAK